MPTEETVKRIMAETLAVEAGSIHESFSPADAATWDSLNTLRMVTALEQAFDIRFAMSEVVTLNSYGKILAAVEAHRKA